MENVRKVIAGVREWRDVGDGLLVPDAILDKIAVECSRNDERISALASYVVTTVPNITWEDIAAALYGKDEKRAMERVKPYTQRFDGKYKCTRISYDCICTSIAVLMVGWRVLQLYMYTCTVYILQQSHGE